MLPCILFRRNEEEFQKIKDNTRQQALEDMGLHFLRFSDIEVRKNIDNVLKEIENYIVAYHEMWR